MSDFRFTLQEITCHKLIYIFFSEFSEAISATLERTKELSDEVFFVWLNVFLKKKTALWAVYYRAHVEFQLKSDTENGKNRFPTEIKTIKLS